MIIKGNFRPAWWLPSPHGQTMWPTLIRREIMLPIRNQRLELWDGDFIDLVWSERGVTEDAPIIILLHGLGGGISSPYAKGLLQAFNKMGWRGLLMHFRGCGQEPNRLDRSYHSGETGDFNFLLQWLQQHHPNVPIATVGISLGGNVLLKWLGENPSNQLITAGVAVSVPFLLNIAADKIATGSSVIYQRWLMKKLHDTVRRKYANPNRIAPFDLDQLPEWTTFEAFDNHITAPLHGFYNAHDYYQKASSRQYLLHITTPTLIIHAKDDPFMTPEVIPSPQELSHSIEFELCEKGGHVGFVTGLIPGKAEYWLEQRIPQYLSKFIPGTIVFD